MRILQIVSHGFARGGARGVGGPERRALETLKRLDRGRFDPVVVYSSDGALYERFLESGVRPIDFSVRGIEHFGAGRFLADVIRSERIDVVHTQGALAADFYAARAARAGGVPLVLTRPVMVEDYLTFPLKRSAYAVADTLTLRSATAIVAVSDDGRRRLLARRALRRSEILLIRNGIDVDLYRPREDAKARLLADAGKGGDTPTIGMVAQLTDDKGWDVFLEAVLQVRRSIPDLAAFVVGGGPRESEIRLSVAHTGLEGTVFLLGHRSDVHEILPAFDVVVHTSRREGLPLIVIEAMASGRPVVASDAAGTAELIVPDVTGHVVPVGDPRAAADRVTALLRDPAARRRMGLAGRERAVTEFTLDRMVSEYQALYERVGRRGRGAGSGVA